MTPTEPYWDEKIGSFVIKESKDWIVSVTPMIFNDRVLLTLRSDYPHGWTAGWCYDKGGAAAFAASIWDPDETDAPVGFKKLAGDSRR